MEAVRADCSAFSLRHCSGHISALYVGTDGRLRADFFDVQNATQMATTEAYNDNNWHLVVLSYENGTETFYVDGQLVGYQVETIQSAYGAAYGYYVGTGAAGGPDSGEAGWFYFNGSIDEVRVSESARSGDWVQAEYNNQKPASSFYALYPENAQAVAPTSVKLYASQFQQFLAPGNCNASTVVWSMPPGVPGTLSASGLYTAPATIDSQQTVTITANTLGASSASVSATVTLMPPVTISVTPAASVIAGGQQRQFVANVANASNTAVTWTIPTPGMGTIDASGLYSAPASVTTQQTVYVTATSMVDTNQSASATITVTANAPALPVSVSMNPASATLYGGQTQQLTASVYNTSNIAVTWTISPAGVGTVSANGLYTAPETIAAQQTVTVTATSQADPVLTAFAMITLAPTPCASAGYAYHRTVVIDHTKVPNTDQTNFPFLFNTTDPTFASVANGGHVSSPNGYDIVFSTDPNGLTKLDHELEEYNPVTGQVIAWVRMPTLSHTSDTMLYVFYGNSTIETSQQDPNGVWDSNYLGVWHLPNGTTLSANDSTSNGHDGTLGSSTTPTAGQIDGGQMSTHQLPEQSAFPPTTPSRFQRRRFLLG